MMADGAFPQRGPSTPAFQTTTNHPTYPAASSSTSAAYGVLVLIAVYYLLKYLESHHLPLSELLWNSLVYVTPTKMLTLLDPSSFISSTQEPEDDNLSYPKGFDSRHHASKSNSMRRVLGLNNSSIVKAVQHTRKLSDLGGVFKSKPTRGLPGLGNWDHSCYQNSVIQGLASLEDLPEFLRRDDAEGGKEVWEEGATRRALRELTETLNDEGKVGKTFWTPSALKSMSSWQQQDAQEYFSKVMDGLEKDAARSKKLRNRLVALESLSVKEDGTEVGTDANDRAPTPQIVRMNNLPEELQSMIAMNPLEGLLAQRVGCQECGYVEGLSLVPFNCLTVPLGRQWVYDVRDCLDEYTALESINGVDCAKCTLLRARDRMDHILKQSSRERNLENMMYASQLDALLEDTKRRLDNVQKALDDRDFSDNALKTCQIPSKSYVSTTKSRQAVIARAPKALVIHVNRSIFDELTGEQSKNLATVRFPRELNLDSWCLGTASQNLEEPPTENWNTDPRKSMLENEKDVTTLTNGRSYKLRAVITHYGRHENGHYICYRQSPYDTKNDDELDDDSPKGSRPWWRLSDEEVKEVSEDVVLAQGGVFMLFYEQVPSSPPSAPVILNQGLDETSIIRSTEQDDGTFSSGLTRESESLSEELESVDKHQAKVAPASAYPTPPPEQSIPDFGRNAEKPLKSPKPMQVSLTLKEPQPSSNPLPLATSQSSPASTIDPATSPSDTSHKSRPDIRRLHTPPAEPIPVVPSPTMTLSPRSGMGRDRRSNVGLESMGGTVQAN